MSPQRKKMHSATAVVARNLMLAPMVVAMRAPILGAEAGGFLPMQETSRAVGEKAVAFAQGMVAAQIEWVRAAAMLPLAFAETRSPFLPLLDMAESVTSAALAPAARQVRRNANRLMHR